VTKGLTIFWGAFSIAFAMYANRLGSLIEAVNRLGSLFYGTILAIFILAFFAKGVGGRATCLGAVIGFGAVVYFWLFTHLAWLWWNVIGCVVGVAAALFLERLFPEREEIGEAAESPAQ